jgi:DNA end-binding protein Ku
MASTVWRGYVTFGLISIPVRLIRAARAERVSFRRLYREEPTPDVEQRSRADITLPAGPESRGTGDSRRRSEQQLTFDSRSTDADDRSVPALTPVQQAFIPKGSDEILPAESVVKGFEYEKNRFVAIEPEELKNAVAQTSSEMQIQEFVTLADIDPVYFENVLLCVAGGGGRKSLRALVPIHAINRLGRDCTICDAQSGTRSGASSRPVGHARAHHVLCCGSAVRRGVSGRHKRLSG